MYLYVTVEYRIDRYWIYTWQLNIPVAGIESKGNSRISQGRKYCIYMYQ